MAMYRIVRGHCMIEIMITISPKNSYWYSLGLSYLRRSMEERSSNTIADCDFLAFPLIFVPSHLQLPGLDLYHIKAVTFCPLSLLYAVLYPTRLYSLRQDIRWDCNPKILSRSFAEMLIEDRCDKLLALCKQVFILLAADSAGNRGVDTYKRLWSPILERRHNFLLYLWSSQSNKKST